MLHWGRSAEEHCVTKLINNTHSYSADTVKNLLRQTPSPLLIPAPFVPTEDTIGTYTYPQLSIATVDNAKCSDEEDIQIGTRSVSLIREPKDLRGKLGAMWIAGSFAPSFVGIRSFNTAS